MAQDRSLEGKLVVLVGGSGFFGTHIAQALLQRGARVRVASRHPERAFKLKPLGNLGQVQAVGCDVTKPHTVKAAMTGADAAVYLVGAFSGDLDALQADGAGIAAQAARDAGAEAFVHVSAIGADSESDVGYARTKAAGEAAVLAAFPKATVLRPSVLFGRDDNFINMFARLVSTLPALPIFGADAELQPLFVDDAAEAVASAIADPGQHGGKIYEIAGPEVITMGALNRRIAEAQERKPLFVEVPDVLSAVFAALPGTPMNRDQWALLKAGSTAAKGAPGLKQMGITPRPLELFLDRWMVSYRKHGRFTEAPVSKA